MNIHYDVVISGGGTVGLLLACALGEYDIHIAVIEQYLPDNTTPVPLNLSMQDIRVSTINCASQKILEALGVWDVMQNWQRIKPFHKMCIWDAAGFGQLKFNSTDFNEPCLGWVIENNIIQYSLLKRVKQINKIDLLYPTSLKNIRPDNHHWHLILRDGRTLTTKLLVGADGAQSIVRTQAGITVRTRYYEQQAIITNVRTAEDHQDTAWQRFYPTGPLAFLPLVDGRCSIVWSTKIEHAQALVKLSAHNFRLALGRAFDWKLGSIIQSDTPRYAINLISQYAYNYVQPGLALIGDAAHVIHPLAGQGLNLGILDAATLAEVIADAISENQDISSMKVLCRYEILRKKQNMLMLFAMDCFHFIFCNSILPITLLRNIGLNITASNQCLKKNIAKQAMGIASNLPRLALSKKY